MYNGDTNYYCKIGNSVSVTGLLSYRQRKGYCSWRDSCKIVQWIIKPIQLLNPSLMLRKINKQQLRRISLSKNGVSIWRTCIK